MKAALFLVGLMITAVPSLLPGAPTPAYDTYDELLHRYVTPSGVRYDAWSANPADREALEQILESWGKIPAKPLSPDARKAFLINLYNAAMIHEVLENYPVESVRDIGPAPFSVFRQQSIVLSGERVSLDQIEKQNLLQQFPDPRVHFAVNCASISCPPLRPESFRAATLDTQLEEQARSFSNSPLAAKVDDTAPITAYSKIFEWYADDFPGKNPAEYLNQYRSTPLPLSNRIEWMEYDWSLNAAN